MADDKKQEEFVPDFAKTFGLRPEDLPVITTIIPVDAEGNVLLPDAPPAPTPQTGGGFRPFRKRWIN